MVVHTIFSMVLVVTYTFCIECTGLDFHKTTSNTIEMFGTIEEQQEVRNILECARVCLQKTECMGMTYNETLCSLLIGHKDKQPLTSFSVDIYKINKECKFKGYMYVWEIDTCIKIEQRLYYNWTDAKQLCEHEEGHLIIIDTDDKDMLLLKIITDLHEENKVYNYWIGGSDREEEGYFKWVDGSALTYNKWSPGQPDNNGNRNADCVRYYFGTDTATWFDRSCTSEYGFMCENRKFK